MNFLLSKANILSCLCSNSVILVNEVSDSDSVDNTDDDGRDLLFRPNESSAESGDESEVESEDEADAVTSTKSNFLIH